MLSHGGTSQDETSLFKLTLRVCIAGGEQESGWRLAVRTETKGRYYRNRAERHGQKAEY